MPSSIALAKPGTRTDNIAGAIQDTTSGDGRYIMLLHRARLGFYTDVAEVTADGDQFPTVSTSEWLDADVVFQGWMTALDVINILDLNDLTHNPSANQINFYLSDTRRIDFTMVAGAITVEWNFEAPFVGVTIEGKRTLDQDDITDDFSDSAAPP